MIYIFDIDGTICTLVKNANYDKAKPLKERIEKVNKLYIAGNIIKLYTARGSSTGIDWAEITKKQLREFGLVIGFGFPIIIGWIIPFLSGHSFRAWSLYLGLPLLILGIILTLL